MMIRFMDGFDQYTGQQGERLSGSLVSGGYGVTGNVSIIEGRKELTKCLSIEGKLERVFNSTAQKVVIGFAYMAPEERSPIVEIENVLKLDWEAEISIGDSKGVAIPILGMWWYYEIIIDKVNETITVRINGEDDLEVAMPGAATFMQDYKVSWSSGGSPKMLDDVYFLDSSGGKYKEPLGPIQLGLMVPDSDVVSEFHPSEGTRHYPLVSQMPPNDSDFVQSNESGAVDTFLAGGELPLGDVLAFGVVMRVRKSDIDGRQAAAIIGDPEDSHKIVVHTELDIEPEYKYAVFETGPDGADWDYVSLAQTPFGVQVKP